MQNLTSEKALRRRTRPRPPGAHALTHSLFFTTVSTIHLYLFPILRYILNKNINFIALSIKTIFSWRNIQFSIRILQPVNKYLLQHRCADAHDPRPKIPDFDNDPLNFDTETSIVSAFLLRCDKISYAVASLDQFLYSIFFICTMDEVAIYCKIPFGKCC